MDIEAQIIEGASENEAKLEEIEQRIKYQRKNQDLKCNVCGKNYENINNLKVSEKFI